MKNKAKKIWLMIKIIVISVILFPFMAIDILLNLLRLLDKWIIFLIYYSTKYLDKRIYVSFMINIRKFM